MEPTLKNKVEKGRKRGGEMNVQGLQKLTLLDYPGRVAATVFTGGCNLRCPFCHNGTLVKKPMQDPELSSEVLSYLESRKGILEGVCITGGEPLLQPDLADFIGKIKALGLPVKLDTNGALPGRLRTLLESGLVDYVAMDVKNAPAHYATATGSDIPFSVFEESIQLIKHCGVSYEFRTTAVRGIHDIEDFVNISELLGDVPYYIQRFVDSGNLLGEGCSAFSDEEHEEILSAVRKYSPRAQLRG